METAQVPQVEIVTHLEGREKRDPRELVTSAMNTVHSFWNEQYDLHNDTFTPQQKKDFALFNMGVLRTSGGEKRSFGVLKGKVKQGPFVSGAISFAREQAKNMKDISKQEELLIAAKVLEMNSAPFFRTENRREQKRELVSSLAFDLAAATEGSHEHASTYAQTAEEMLESQLELVIPIAPNPDAVPVRKAVSKLTLHEKTISGALDALSAAVTTSKKRFGRSIPRSPQRTKIGTPLTNPTTVDTQRAQEDETIATLAEERLLTEKKMDGQFTVTPETPTLASLEPTASEILKRMRETTANLEKINDENEIPEVPAIPLLAEEEPGQPSNESNTAAPVVETPASETPPESLPPQSIQPESLSQEIVRRQTPQRETPVPPVPADYIAFHNNSLRREAEQPTGSYRSLHFPETNPVRTNGPEIIPQKTGMRQMVSGLLRRFGRRNVA